MVCDLGFVGSLLFVLVIAGSSSCLLVGLGSVVFVVVCLCLVSVVCGIGLLWCSVYCFGGIEVWFNSVA